MGHEPDAKTLVKPNMKPMSWSPFMNLRNFGNFFVYLLFVPFIVFSIGTEATSVRVVNKSIPTQLQEFDLVSGTSGWVLLNKQIFWTNDAGQTWEAIGPSIPSIATVQDVEFIDSNIGWLLWATIANDGSSNFTLAHTTNRGEIWSVKPLPLFEPGDISAYAEEAEMGWLDAQNGWLKVKQSSSSNFSLGTLFLTSDGGNNWARSSLPIADQIWFSDPQIGWVVGGPTGAQIFKTLDGGATWLDMAPSLLSGPSTTAAISFLSVRHKVLVMTSLELHDQLFIRMFHNQSDAWIDIGQATVDAQSGHINLSILDAQNLLAMVPGSTSILSMQDGVIETYVNQDGLSPFIVDLEMFSLEVGWAKSVDSICSSASSLGDESATIACSSDTRLLRTNNGGLTWQEIQLPLTISTGVLTSSAGENLVTTVSSLANPGNTEVLIGQGFDKCEIPSIAQMQTWMDSSPYRAVNLYIGGVSRTCSNNALTSSYLETLHQQGWKFIPTWVGPQAPCTNYLSKISSNLTTAYAQGVNEANLAVEKLSELGLTYSDKTGSVVYYDIEYYGTSDTACRNAVNAFMNGWVSQIRVLGSLAGVYGSTLCNTGLSDFLNITNVPDVIWPARWYHNLGEGFYDPNATVWGLGSCIPDSAWANHQRIRQYEGDHDEIWGGLRLRIDSNVLDGVVAIPSSLDPAKLSFYEVISGLNNPVFITNASDSSGRLFIVERNGSIRILKNGALLATPFLDIQASVKSTSGEQGLLSLAFHPSYEANGKFYVVYTAPREGDSVGSVLTLKQFSVSANPDVADPATGMTFLTIDHPFQSNHNGGTLAFGNDGYLYWSTGDGGGGGDPYDNGQNLTSLLGKIIRIDVNSGPPYAVPASNPFYSSPNSNTRLIWAYGLRNPWRMSFDRATHDLYIGDVGQGSREEIDFQPSTSSGGENYGWDIMEGSICYNANTCDQTGKVLPVAEYDHSLGCSVTGGYVYRGLAFPSLIGRYFYGDYCSGRIFSTYKTAPTEWSTPVQLADTTFNITTFGEDEQGELYLADYATGKIYQLRYQEPTNTISGHAGTDGVILTYEDEGTQTVTSQADGNYSIAVPSGWDGIVTPTHTCYTFTPSSRTYSNVSINQTNQDYTAAFNLASGCANIAVTITDDLMGNYAVAHGDEKRIFFDKSGGPVVVDSVNDVDIVAAIRLQSMQAGKLLDYNESLGIPGSSLSHEYYFPVYENLWAPLNSQIRFAHLNPSATQIKVTIGTEVVFNESVPANTERRLSFPKSGGPVIIESVDGVTKVLAAIRLQCMNSGVLNCYSETPGLPVEALSAKYYFPVYENLWGPLNSQLRFSHLSPSATQLRVTIGGEVLFDEAVPPNTEKRLSFPKSGGPVIVESVDGVTQVIAAIRLQAMSGGVLRDYNESMGIPENSLSHKYYFPVYENLWAPLNSQIRFAHLNPSATQIRVTIGGEVVFDEEVPANTEKRLSFPKSGGPVIIESVDGVTQVIAAIRLQCMNSGVLNCYSETPGLPVEALDTLYYFPVYENLWALLNSQLRFSVP